MVDRARRYDEQLDHWRQAQVAHWTDTPAVNAAAADATSELDADYWRLQLVPYLQETGADTAEYEAWGVPVEYRPAG